MTPHGRPLLWRVYRSGLTGDQKVVLSLGQVEVGLVGPRREISDFGAFHLFWRLEDAAHIQHAFRKRPRKIH